MTTKTKTLPTPTAPPTPNITLFREIQQYFMDEPRRVIMRDWVDKDIVEDFAPPCGTVSCIGGTALLLSGYTPSRIDRLNRETVFRRAEELLGLPVTTRKQLAFGEGSTSTIGMRLFLLSHWPKAMARKHDAISQAQYDMRPCFSPGNPKRFKALKLAQAKLVCKRIDLFLEKGI